jgi:hypothetical protein
VLEGEKLSRAYANPWIVKNRFEGKVELYARGADDVLGRMDYPVTNMVLVGERRSEMTNDQAPMTNQLPMTKLK